MPVWKWLSPPEEDHGASPQGWEGTRWGKLVLRRIEASCVIGLHGKTSQDPPVLKFHNCTSSKAFTDLGFFCCCCCYFLFFFGVPAQGSDPRNSGDLRHSSGNAGSFNPQYQGWGSNLHPGAAEMLLIPLGHSGISGSYRFSFLSFFFFFWSFCLF